MPWRPASLASEIAAARSRPRRAPRRLRRVLLAGLLIVLLVPPALLLVYRFLPVPLTPLMVIRLLEGEGLRKRWVSLDEVAPVLPQAVVAAEDNWFCEHAGFDWEELGGQIDALLAGASARGASTITMQTAKNLFLWPSRDFVRKALEAWLTPQIELLWPKRRIMEVYLNVVERRGRRPHLLRQAGERARRPGGGAARFDSTQSPRLVAGPSERLPPGPGAHDPHPDQPARPDARLRAPGVGRAVE